MKLNVDQLKVGGYVNYSSSTLGLDSIDQCLDKSYFKKYPYTISYQFNEIGFRDIPISGYLKNSIIVIGDSFTVGLGLPLELTYPKQLEKIVNNQVLNFGLNGASNDWICRKLHTILQYFNPAAIIVHYTFTHRRELDKQDWFDDERTLCPKDRVNEIADCENWLQNHSKIKDLTKNIPTIYSSIPNWHHNANYDNVIKIPKMLDFARDKFHYGEKTCSAFADELSKLL